MRMLFKNHMENALEAMRTNRLRTTLTVLGAVVGTASITAVLSLAAGAAIFFQAQVDNSQDAMAVVRPSTILSSSSILAQTQSLQPSSTLTEKDAADISRIPNVTSAPLSLIQTTIKTSEPAAEQKITLIGSTVGLMSVAKLSILDGQFFVDDDNVSGIVLGKQLAIDIFGTEHSLGSVVKIKNQTFTVMGILQSTDEPINYLGVNFDRSAIITTAAMKKFNQGVLPVQQIVLATQDPTAFSTVIDSAKNALEANHGGEQDYALLTGSDVVAPNSELFSLIIKIVGIISGISLLVGGIGIMNIMLVNVAERNREVGIRKAIGASSGHIINQFLIESTIIGLTGGVIGYLIGLSVAFITSIYLPFLAVFQWQVALISIGISTVTGIIFGLYPALRAAKKDPITALRQ